MKIIFSTLFISLLLFSCFQKTEKNSRYSEEIAELKRTFISVDSNYKEFQKLNLDSLSSLKRIVDAKYEKIKTIHQADKVDNNYDVIMLTARGQFTKKIPLVVKKKKEIEAEFELSAKNYDALSKNLITENLDENKSMLYYYEEKNALMLLNAEILNFIEETNNTLTLSTVIVPQMDSIIKVYDNQ